MEQVLWKAIKHIQLGNEKIEISPLLPGGSGLLLLQQILNMPPGNLIPFSEAVVLAYYQEGLLLDSQDTKQVESFKNNWIYWLSEKGYQIALTLADYDI